MPDRQSGAESVRHRALGFEGGRRNDLSFFQYSGHSRERRLTVKATMQIPYRVIAKIGDGKISSATPGWMSKGKLGYTNAG